MTQLQEKLVNWCCQLSSFTFGTKVPICTHTETTLSVKLEFWPIRPGPPSSTLTFVDWRCLLIWVTGGKFWLSYLTKLPIPCTKRQILGGNLLVSQISSIREGIGYPTSHGIQHIKARRLRYSPLQIYLTLCHILTTMHVPFMLAVVAALIASISASDTDSEKCPIFCIAQSTCKHCTEGVCVSTVVYVLYLTVWLTDWQAMFVCS